MIWTSCELIILALINFFAGLCFGYLLYKTITKINIIKFDECDVHDWEYGVDRNREGWPFVRKCKICAKGEFMMGKSNE